MSHNLIEYANTDFETGIYKPKGVLPQFRIGRFAPATLNKTRYNLVVGDTGLSISISLHKHE